jgi:hypothetical protein
VHDGLADAFGRAGDERDLAAQIEEIHGCPPEITFTRIIA